MSFVKAKLKASREALGQKNYPVARDAASAILDYEPDNYNARVFLGLALLELGQLEQSEQTYRKATELNPTQILAWQGLSKLYERGEKWDKYIDTLNHLAQHFATSGDATKCAESVQKLVELRREHGTRTEIMDVLRLYLPASSLYSTLSNLPPPDPTNPTATTTYAAQWAIIDSLPILEEIVTLGEKEESETIRKEVEKRRMRLGAPGPEQLRKDVGRDVWGSSQLPSLYDEILNHPNTPDELRREIDAKLLRLKQNYLYALPSTGEWTETKAKVAEELTSLVNGAVVLRIPDELAWILFFEGNDCDTLEGYDFSLVHQYIRIFPARPLASLFRGYFMYMGIEIPANKDDKNPPPPQDEEDPFDLMLDASVLLPDSIIATRVLGEVYLQDTDYQNAIKVSESGLELVGRWEVNNGKALPLVRKALNVVLATSLVHLFPPKHHPRAIRLLDEVLAGDADNIACLMGRAYIHQEAQRWPEAGALFSRVAKLAPDDVRALEEAAWCESRDGDLHSGIDGLKRVLEGLEELQDRDEDKARCVWRIGKCHWDLGGDERESAFKYFITSLKRNSTYAPAFTSLGVYYLEVSSPADPTRASKCFQKAFELDAREADAARRLAEGFAEEREWDLVEVVARRTIEGEGGADAGLKTGDTVAASRYLPKNAWAWKAVGVVELTRRNYAPAIQAFQIALRADPDDQLSWLRLGEAYSKAGRHAAAVKALARALELDPNDWMCAFFIGEVERQTGQFKEAIHSFTSILATRPTELGVLLSLGQTHLDLGCAEHSTGFIARAEASFVDAIQVSLQAVADSAGFRGIAWKTVADAVFFLSKQSSFIDEENVRSALSEVVVLVADGGGDRLAGIVTVKADLGEAPLNGLRALEIAAAAYDHRISLGTSDGAGGSAWHDLGMSLHTYSAQISSGEAAEDEEKKARTNKQASTCLTTALREDPGNDSYWNALGNVNFLQHPKIAQHAYIKAIEIDNKNVMTWTNLGLLYLHHGDMELANEAFYRAQTLDSDYTIAWVGQGLVATANEHHAEGQGLFEHAVSLTADVPEADLEFASRVFERLREPSVGGRKTSPDELLPAFFVLDRYCKRRPDDPSALHLFGLICERLGQFDLAVDLVQRAIAILEAAYEEAEDPVVERQFTIANSNLARLRLATEDYAGALESFESALGLLSDEDDGNVDTRTMRAQAQFGSGLAHFKLGDLAEALPLFEAALDSASEDLVIGGQVTVLLAQTLWAIGTEDYKETAKTQLLECITNDPENLAAINALAGMGILTDDDSLVDAALSEILALPLERRRELDPQRDVSYLLMQHHIGQKDVVKALSVAQAAVFAEPSRTETRRDVASLMIQKGGEGYDAARAVLAVSSAEGGPGAELQISTLGAIAEVLSVKAKPEDVASAAGKAQRAIILSPGTAENWQALAFVRSRQES